MAPTHRRESEDLAKEGSGLSRLSPRERQILGLAAAGYVDKQIGRQLGVSVNTLRTYWSRIRSKVGFGSRTGLAAAYIGRTFEEREPAAAGASKWDWQIDLRSRTYKQLSANPSLGLHPGQEMPLARILDFIHPEDRLRAVALLEEPFPPGLEAFHYVLRIVTPEGVSTGSSVVDIVRDDSGQPSRLMGRRVPSVDLRDDPASNESPGHWG